MDEYDRGEAIDPRLLFGLVASSDAGRRTSVFQEFSGTSINLRVAYEAIARLPFEFLDEAGRIRKRQLKEREDTARKADTDRQSFGQALKEVAAYS
jgi:hypothetical protein